jgi:pimeloyl-ACP methyl ester carboxylesterase
LKFAGGDAFWQMLWWGILSDVPTGLERIDCPVILAQGTADLVTAGQTPRHLAAIAQARFVPLVGRACPAVRCSGRRTVFREDISQ